ncbi:MAG: putative ABC exporter domain-containing protein, partial [Verrucomicrobiota bacterium]
MIAALLFLQFHSTKNRLLTRIRRLRQPKYLFGAIVGGTYFYFYFGRHLFSGGTGVNAASALVPQQFHFEMLAAFALFILIISAWIFPHKRAALAFTEAEVAFLFPAPVSRKTLIHFKLLKSQTGILFTVLFLSLITRRFGGGGHGWIHVVGWWIILSTLNLHFIGSSFARTLLLDRGISNWVRRFIVLLALAVVIVFLAVWGRNTLPPFDITEMSDLPDIARYAENFFQSGPLPYLLFPFQLILKPFLAPDLKTFLFAFAPALLTLTLHYLWVIRSNVAFEEASVEASQKMAERVASVRAGNWHASAKPKKKSRAPFQLKPLGA